MRWYGAIHSSMGFFLVAAFDLYEIDILPLCYHFVYICVRSNSGRSKTRVCRNRVGYGVHYMKCYWIVLTTGQGITWAQKPILRYKSHKIAVRYPPRVPGAQLARTSPHNDRDLSHHKRLQCVPHITQDSWSQERVKVFEDLRRTGRYWVRNVQTWA